MVITVLDVDTNKVGVRQAFQVLFVIIRFTNTFTLPWHFGTECGWRMIQLYGTRKYQWAQISCRMNNSQFYNLTVPELEKFGVPRNISLKHRVGWCHPQTAGTDGTISLPRRGHTQEEKNESFFSLLLFCALVGPSFLQLRTTRHPTTFSIKLRNVCVFRSPLSWPRRPVL